MIIHIMYISFKLNNKKIKELEEEIDVYREIPPHKNIVTYYGSDQKKDSLLIFLEYVEGNIIVDLLLIKNRWKYSKNTSEFWKTQ